LAYFNIYAQDTAEHKWQEAEVTVKVKKDAKVFLAYILSLDTTSDNGLGNRQF
jgi:hypothetical protein